MPGFDGTGPMGAGAMTGGRRGYCSPVNAARQVRPFGPYGGRGAFGFGRGFRNFGWGYRRGLGGRFSPFPPYDAGGTPADAATEAQMLKQEATELKAALDSINKRLSELESAE